MKELGYAIAGGFVLAWREAKRKWKRLFTNERATSPLP
jgi:hypothetical protein